MKRGRFSGRRRSGSGKGGSRSPLGEHNQRKPQRHTTFITKVVKKSSSTLSRSQLSTSPSLSASRVPKMSECSSIEKMAQVAFDNFLVDSSHLRDIAAFWSHSNKSIDNKDHDGVVEVKQQTLMKLTAIRNHTIKHIETFDAADFSKSFVALAKILSSLTKKQTDVSERDDINLFRCILLDNGNQPKENPFQFFVYASISFLPRLTPRDMACVSYALSLISKTDALKDTNILLDAISSEVVNRVTQFDSRSLARILYDVAKSGQQQSELFSVVGSYMCDLDATRFAPNEMANILFAFTTVNETNPTIYRKLADAIVSQYNSSTRLSWFKPEDVATIMWSFAKAEELHHHDQFQQKMRNALYTKLHRVHEVFHIQDLTDVIWALSKSSSSNHSSILKKIATRINLDVQSMEYEAKYLAKLLWTCCESNVHIEELFCPNSRLMTACLEKKDDYSDAELRKLYGFHLWQQKLNCCGLPSELHDRCFETHLLPNNLLSEYD